MREHPTDIHLTKVPAAGSSPAGQLARELQAIQDDWIAEHRTPLSNTLLSLPYPGLDVTAHHAFAAAEVIHLHWPTWGVTPRSIEAWLAGGRTVFWTLHDYWPMTGGCHYPAGCEQYQTVCLRCPQLQGDPSLVTNSFTEKLWAYQHRGQLHIVAPSEWMASVARGSRMFGGRPVEVVRNAIDLDVFTPRPDRAALRRAFGIGPDELVLISGSYDVVEQRKGIKYLLAAIRQLAGQPGFPLVHLAVLGKSSAVEPSPGVLPLNLGTVGDDAVLADLLSVADLACVPSLEENYPNMIVEAMACGTPCLGTAVGGIPEMIADGVDGILVPQAGSVDALTQGLLRFVGLMPGAAAMRDAARSTAVRNNDPAVVGRRLRQLYEAALGRPSVAHPPSVHARAARAFATQAVRVDAVPGRALLGFPLNLALTGNGVHPSGPEQIPVPLGPAAHAGPPDLRFRLVSVRSHHEHHSARSGPYQFLRHLPDAAYRATHLAVPLGAELAREMADSYRQAGQLLGVPAFGNQGNAWLAEAEVAMQCVAEPVDVVHFIDGELGGWFLPRLPGRLFARGRRPAVVTTYHQPPAILAGFVNAALTGAFDGVVVLCESQRVFLQKHVPAERIFLIPHGIDTGFFHPRPAAFAKSPGAAFRLLLVGHWLRDLHAAFAALDAVVAAGLHAELTIVSPSLTSSPGRRVSVRSNLSDEALREAYWDADLVFLPLKDATANNAVLEAMACGRPVLSTAIGGVAEAVGADAGILCPPGDVAGLTAAILQLAANPDRRRAMGRAGRARAEMLDWSIIAARHHEMYQAVAARA